MCAFEVSLASLEDMCRWVINRVSALVSQPPRLNNFTETILITTLFCLLDQVSY